MNLKFLFVFFICSHLHAADGWSDYLAKLEIGTNYPDHDSLELPWRDSTDFVIVNALSPDEAGKTPLSCKNSKLWPTHPYQTTKEYLWAGFAHYQHHKLPVDSYACLRPNPTNRFCLMGAIAMAVVMSDTFEDECGNVYRGYWLVSYLKHDENMGTLFSKGRTAYPRPGSPYEYDMIEGNTYPLKNSDFLFLGALLPLDHDNIALEQDRALKNGFTRKAKAFLRID